MPSPFTNSHYLFLYLLGTGSTRLASRKIYSSSHETHLSILSRRATLLMYPPVSQSPVWRPSDVWNVLVANQARRTGCSILGAWRIILLRSKQFTWIEGAVVDWWCVFFIMFTGIRLTRLWLESTMFDQINARFASASHTHSISYVPYFWSSRSITVTIHPFLFI